MVKKQQQSKAKKLLIEYRPTMLRKTAFESLSEAGNKVFQACTEQILFTQRLVERLREDRLLGEKFYWIIYISYMTNRQPGSVDEILSDIAEKHERIPRRTYFRLRGRAIKILDKYLEETPKRMSAEH